MRGDPPLAGGQDIRQEKLDNDAAVRIGDEFFEITSVSNNLTATATLNVTARGSDIFGPTSAVLLTKTVATDHSAGDEVFICDLSDDETIDSLITKVFCSGYFES